MRFVVVSAKNRSTRLSHDALVGVKCSLKRGCLASRAYISGVLCADIPRQQVFDAIDRVVGGAAVDPGCVETRSLIWFSSRFAAGFYEALRGWGGTRAVDIVARMPR